MSEGNKTVLLIGASGLVGKELLTYLLENSAYIKVKILLRNPISIEHPKLEQVVIDFDKLESYENHFQVNDVYCCLGTTIKNAGTQKEFRKVDFEYPVTLCKLAKENHVQKFLIITALGADVNSKFFYNRIKGEIEETIKKMGIPSLHIFQPSLLLGKRKEFRIGERIVGWLSPVFNYFFFGGFRKYKAIKAEDVASAMFSVGQQTNFGTYTYLSDEIEKIAMKRRT